MPGEFIDRNILYAGYEKSEIKGRKHEKALLEEQ